MEIRFRWLKLTKRSLTILLGIVVLALGLKFGLELSYWTSAFISVLSVLLSTLIVVISRWPKYHSFLDTIGKKISTEEFHKLEPVVSIVPFNGHSISCWARIDGNRLLFGKARHWRSLRLDEIEGVDLFQYAGFEIASLDVTNIKGDKVSFCIPWSKSFQDNVEFY
jgi:hypothetical protein